MRGWLLVAAATVGCGGGGGATGDAAGSGDAAAADAPVDAFVDDCPNRTELLGQPPASTTVGQTHFGDITVRSQAEIDALAGISFINGDLTVSTGIAQTTVTFPDLVAVSGIIAFTDTHQLIEFPKLETAKAVQTRAVDVFHAPRFELGAMQIGGPGDTSEIDMHCLREGMVHLYSPTGSTLALPKLEKAPIVFQIENAPNLIALHLPRLTSAPTIILGHNAINAPKSMGALTTFDAPQLTLIGQLAIYQAPMLTTVALGPDPEIQEGIMLDDVESLPDTHFLAGAHYNGISISQALHLTSLEGNLSGSINIWGAPMLTSLPSLANAGGEQAIISGTALTSIDFPNMTTAITFDINSNDALTNLSAPQLETVGTSNLGYYSDIQANPMLPNCQATAIRDKVLANTSGVMFRVVGNLADGCN